MSAQTPTPPAAPPCELVPFCPEAQADGVPCQDTSSECGSCSHLAQTLTGERARVSADLIPEYAERAQKR